MNVDVLNKIIQKAELRGKAIERTRIASELHDSISQELSLIKSYVKTIEDLPPGSDKLLNYVNDLRELVDQSIHNVRGLSHEIVERSNEHLSLSERVQIIAEKYNRIQGLKIDLSVSVKSLKEKNRGLNNSLLCVIQEFINNSEKHARAKMVSIYIDNNLNGIQIVLFDDGCGFHIDHVSPSFGLSSIERRLKKMGASYSFNSERGRGTKLEILING